jgi:hypothetical protein
MKKPRKRELPYKEGTWFAIPLRQGGYALGRVARHSPGGRIILAYLFGPKREHLPKPDETGGMEPRKAIKVIQIGDSGLIDGSWPIVGNSPDWERESGPSPHFIRRDDISRTAWRVVYSDEDPNKVAREERIPYESTELESAGLYGTKAVEAVLSQILG